MILLHISIENIIFCLLFFVKLCVRMCNLLWFIMTWKFYHWILLILWCYYYHYKLTHIFSTDPCNSRCRFPLFHVDFCHISSLNLSFPLKIDDASSFKRCPRYKSCFIDHSINIQVCPNPFNDMLVNTTCDASLIDMKIIDASNSHT